jgi:hypothetical protein
MTTQFRAGSRPPTWQAALVGLTVLAAACQAGSTASPSATVSTVIEPSASPTVAESPAPSAAGSGAATPVVTLPPGSLARVLIETPTYRLQGPDGIVPPAEPSIGTLAVGQEIAVLEGPRLVDGRTWYLVLPAAEDSSSEVWMRVDREGALVTVDPACPGGDQGAFALRAWDRVACYDHRTITLEATVGHCLGGVVQVDPEWLGYACWRASDPTGDIGLHAVPGSGITFPDDAVRARISGHFDDPAASSCRFLHANDSARAWFEPSDGEQVLLCRESFVVETFEVLQVIGPNDG